MKREILFRGKGIRSGEWVKGSLLVDRQWKANEEPKDYIAIKTIAFGQHEVIPETVGQFTGLLDKNGVKIFEGDEYAAPNGRRGTITYQNPCFGFYNLNDPSDENFYIPIHMKTKESNGEVTGNIHDQ